MYSQEESLMGYDRKDSMKRYRETHKEKIKEQKKIWDTKNAKHVKEYSKAYDQKNRDKICEYRREYRRRDPKRDVAYCRKYRTKNREKYNVARQKYYKENTNKLLERERSYRAKMRISYIKKLLVATTGLKTEIIPPQMTEMKRVQLTAIRQLRRMKNAKNT